MGNKLCAPLLKKNYRGHETNPWHSRKDSHLLRLWADIFRVHGDGEYMRWERVSDDVVPVNISCIEDTPNTVFHITAYNRQVEKIFDVKITQPGTIICPATECFVHWRDTASHCEWGLNFSTATDAQRFRESCSFPTQRFARKASSANSLRLSPPKRQRSKAASASSPSSPVRHSHHITSDMRGEDGCEHTQGLTVISTSKSNTRLSRSSPTKPGAQNGNGTSRGQSPPPAYAVIQRRKPHAADDSSVLIVSSSNSNNPAFRRSFPTGRGAEPSLSGVSSFLASPPVKGIKESPQTPTTRVPAEKSGISPKSTPSSKGSSSTTGTPVRSVNAWKYADPHVRPSSAISDMANQKSSSPKHVQISDIVSVNITDTCCPCTPSVINPCLDKPNGILKRDNSLRNVRVLPSNQSQMQTSFAAGSDEKSMSHPRPSTVTPPPALLAEPITKLPKATLRVDTTIGSPKSPQTSSSESPEWPSPPEPLTPQTPQTPNASDQISFDSDQIQKMLRSLPSSPIEKEFSDDDPDLGFHEEYNTSTDTHNKHQIHNQQTDNGRRGSRLSRTKSLNVHDRNTKSSSNPRRQQSMDTPGAPGTSHKVDAPRPRMFNKIALERELKKRNKNIAANYPDSGIGMSSDTAPSLRSDGSSAFFKKGAGSGS